MLTKTKKILLLSSGLAGALAASSVAGVALSSCTVETVNGGSNSSSGITLPDTWYNKDINWTDATSLNNLLIDDNGLVYSNKYMTEIIAILPGYGGSTITIPASVKTISGYNKVTTDGTTTTKTPTGAFEDLTSLTKVVFAGKNVTQIGAQAFKGCTGLQSITLPSSVTLVDTNAFNGCTSLSSINLDNVQYIGISAFEGAMTDIPAGSVSLNLNKTVLIGSNAFSGATGIGSADFSKNTVLTQIADGAFSGCTSLAGDIDLTNATKLITIGNASTPTTGSSFANTAITNVYLPSTAGLRIIAAMTFSGCTNLETVGPKGTTGFKATESVSGIYNQAFAGTKITSADISAVSSSTPLYAGAFSGMTELASVNLGTIITTIPSACFMNCSSLTSLKLPTSITSISGGVSPTFGTSSTSSITFASDSVYPPFYGSGLTSLDLSTVTSYSTTSGSTLNLPDTLFYNCASLESVILKEGTTSIGQGSFAGTTALTSITTSSSAKASEGYTATADITTVGQYAFWKSGISSVNLQAMTSTSYTNLLHSTFTACPNLTTITLPSTITTIEGYAVSNLTKLTSVNFKDLTALKSISYNNFNYSALEDIDLSETQVTTIASGAFTYLPIGAEVSFPLTLNSGFTGPFTDTDGNTITFNFPKGMGTGITSTFINTTTGVLSGFNTSTSSGVTNVLKNVGNLNLSNNTDIKSIGVSTFFESSKLTSLTLPVNSFSSNNIFTAADGITTNASLTDDLTSSSYVKTNVPFGLNEAFKSLSYTGFTSDTSSSTDTEATAKALFNTTNSTTWTEVTKIINSLSYQKSATSETEAKETKPNMSTWTADASQSSSSVMNSDAEQTWTAANDASGTEASVALSNSYTSSGGTSGITINATDTEATIIHNGVTWTYKNDGTNITLTGDVNMYRAISATDNKEYLVFFNQTTYSTTGETTITYYVPSTTSVSVTLTIATKSSS